MNADTLTRFAWIDVTGSPFVEIAALVIFGDGPEDGHVLVDAATRDRMAETAIAAQLTSAENDAAWAAAIRAMPAAPDDWPGLFDATELGGGWAMWQDMRLTETWPPSASNDEPLRPDAHGFASTALERGEG